MSLPAPYLLFLGTAQGNLEIKTALGLAQWRPDKCLGQWHLPGCSVSTGLVDMNPAQAIIAGARSLVIGTAPAGGVLSDDWIPALVQAIEAGLDLVSGLHVRLSMVPELRQAAEQHGRQLIDIRLPPKNIPVGTGRKRSGKRVLTVGTDCCVGKKYTALSLHQAMIEKGMKADFRATGQTGIMIAGGGIPMDAVVSDFLSGAAEMLSPDNDSDHWDVIEGQGSLLHPAYSAVTLGLIHGSQPDAMILCHEAGRTEIDDHPGFEIPALHDCIEQYQQAAALTNPCTRVIGISINTSSLPQDERESFLDQLGQKSRLPCVDPLLTGVAPLLEALI
ncbi:MAG: putative NAD-dependent epimerase/dehydratase family protein [Lysobacterales bacterium]|jgi:uncharacterized NAD-dependent epimerase/dehydratase family protein